MCMNCNINGDKEVVNTQPCLGVAQTSTCTSHHINNVYMM